MADALDLGSSAERRAGSIPVLGTIHFPFAMQIDFEIDGRPVQYFRDAMVGTSGIRTPDGVTEIDSPLSPSTHFSLTLKKEKTVELYGHQVTVEKVRPLLFAGFRPSKYRILIDGVPCVETSGF